jgi:hypothetical protein
MYGVIVDEGENDPFNQPGKYHIPSDRAPLFTARMRLYRQAIILYALVMKVGSNKKYLPVLQRYELLLRSHDCDRKLIEKATCDFTRLVDSVDRKELHKWSMNWMSDLTLPDGDMNLLDLVLFGTHLANSYLAVCKSVEAIMP